MQASAESKSWTQVLKQQAIDESGPGTILTDFETLLRFVGVDGIETGGKCHRIPLARLAQLDELMTHPLRPKMERPQQLSFPHLNGLYLLLRSTGLGVTSGQGKTGRLLVDRDRQEEWSSLCYQEQYFTLLHFMLIASWDIIQEGSSSRAVWINFEQNYRYLTRNRIQPSDDGEPASTFIGRWNEQANAALLELFGIIDLPRVEQRPSENWRLKSVQTTVFGAAVLGRLRDPKTLFGFIDIMSGRATGKEQWLGDLYRDCFPQCMQTLSQNRQPEFVDGLWQFKVSWGKVWRRILIPADECADSLIAAILDAFEFDNDHLYGLSLRDRTGQMIEIAHPEIDEADYYTDEYAIGCLPLDPGQAMKFIFDYGDYWEFSVKLEKILPADSTVTGLETIASQGKPPAQYGLHDDSDEEW